jgi:hypothetical protein
MGAAPIPLAMAARMRYKHENGKSGKRHDAKTVRHRRRPRHRQPPADDG